MKMTLGSLFDGIGGWLLAAKHAGVKPLWASEIASFPTMVTAKHFPDVVQLGDITKIKDLPPVDIVTCGSPCQDLSVAGKRKGLNGERSGLFVRAVELVRRMRFATGGQYPRFFVWENVSGAFSSNRGMDFQAVLEEIGESAIPMPEGNRWAPAGLVQFPGTEIAWRVLDAQYWGVPQRRKRIFLVADFGGQRAGEILFERKSMHGDFETGGETRKRIADGIERRIRAAGFKAGNGSGAIKGSKAGNIGYALEKAATLTGGESGTQRPTVVVYDMTHADEVMRRVPDGRAPTLNARMGTGGNQVPVIANNKSVRRLTPTECERLQGLPDGYTLIDDKSCSDSARYKALGNGMAQPCADYVIRRIVEVMA